MAAKWQQWMPFKIDRFRGSPSVQAMHPTARAGYIYLLLSAWQTDDCSISSDELDLAELSGLGDELWAQYGGRILRNFEQLENGRLRNSVCFEEWIEAKAVFDRRSANALRTNSVRSASDERPMSERTATDERHTGTETGTVTEVQEQKPSREKRERHSSDPRHMEFKEAIRSYWDAKNQGVDMPWGPMEGKQLGMWLREAPHVTTEQFKGFLRGRFKSDVNHGERPAQWIRWVTSYAQPVDRFNKPQGDGNGTSKPSATKQRLDAAGDALRKAVERRGLDAAFLSAEANLPALPEPGSSGINRGLLVGFRAPSYPIQPDERNASTSGTENPSGPELLPAS